MRRVLLRFALLALVVLSGCTGPGGGGEDGTVQAKDDVFAPAQVSAVAGTPVIWKNVGKNYHTVTVQSPAAAPRTYLFDEELRPDGTATFTFDAPGTYDVFCRYHSQGNAGDFTGGMVMKVTVA